MQPITIILLALFALTYVLMLALPKQRPFVALGSAVIFVIIGSIPGTGFSYHFLDALKTIDWNVLMMIGGTMGTVFFFVESKMPQRMSDMLITKMPNVMWMSIVMSLFAGIVSAFLDNVATVLMIAPVALAICRKLKINPVPIIISIAVSSNLQGAATLVGDTTSILLAKEANLDFMNFFWDVGMDGKGRLGMFFVVEVGAIVSAFIIAFLFRRDKQEISCDDVTLVEDKVPTILLVATVAALIGVSFIPYKNNAAPGQFYKPDVTNGLICVFFFLVGLVRELFKKGEGEEKLPLTQRQSFKTVISSIKEIDYFTILLLASLFVVIGGISEAGIISMIGDGIASMGGAGDTKNAVFLIYTVIVFASVILSAFIDNIPYTLTMLSVVSSVVAGLSAKGIVVDPKLFYYGLLCGATLGGNLTPIGASANIAGIGILRREGHEVKTKDFMRIGIPFTLVAVLTGYLLIWLFWKP